MSQFIDMMEQVKRLKNSVGVQGLIDAASAIVGNPIVLFNTEYTLLAHTAAETDDPIWNELITNGTFSTQTQRLFEQEGFIEENASASKCIVLHSNTLKYDRISGKIFNKNNSYVLSLMAVACNKPFGESDTKVFDVICKLITREISKDEVFQEYEQSHREAIIKRLIERTYDIRMDVGQVEIIYDTLGPNLYVVVADLSLCPAPHANAAALRAILQQTQPQYKYAVYADSIVIIVSTHDDTLSVNRELKALIAAFKQHNLYAGISSRFENLFELHKYYTEAVTSMQYALDARSNQRIFPCNNAALSTMAQIMALENGKGIQHFLNAAPEILGNPVLFHDMELRLLSYTAHAEFNDPLCEELITYGISSEKNLKLMETEGFFSSVAHTKAGALLTSRKLRHERISWKIYSIDNITVGCLCMVACLRPFDDDIFVLYGAFCQKFSKEVGTVDAYNSYGQLYSETVINRLISGKIDDYTFFSEDIGNLYDNLKRHLHLVVIDTSTCTSNHVNLTYIRDLFNWADAVNRYAIHAAHTIVILSTDNAPLGEINEFAAIGRVFEQYNIYAGVSTCFENIYDLQIHYKQAVRALTDGIQARPPAKQRIFQYAAPAPAKDPPTA